MQGGPSKEAPPSIMRWETTNASAPTTHPSGWFAGAEASVAYHKFSVATKATNENSVKVNQFGKDSKHCWT